MIFDKPLLSNLSLISNAMRSSGRIASFFAILLKILTTESFTMDITFDLTTPDGKPASALAKVIEARRRELGETTKQACVAMAIDILRSLRAETKVANENKMDLKVQIADDKYYPSFVRKSGAKGKNISSRVLRKGPNGPVVDDAKVVWILGKYVKGQVAHSFEVTDVVSKDKIIKYIVVAESQKNALQYAKERHKRRVRQFKSLAKHALGVAMKSVYDKSSATDVVSSKIQETATKNIDVKTTESGFNSGEVNIYVHDKLNYATSALKNKESSVNISIQNALRKCVGYISQRVKRNGGQIDKSLKMTVDEMSGGV